ncbi:electron transfer flavoprotein subunit alpha/FixB family protein [Ancylobacter oerskovii]|uniref:Electron transfer flavoprotein subunit alpha/FixB family protein n=1 Tax=Ancylobacter oerskovii TaxID=459519 RepID=A0ABW4YSI5_9HYPH|nr:electron transfer flavoprotein subunit alpha/FixB family protein [Ancylobacter oerskovii]MBS7545245.1 electron transfer flavoprotein subunit alpha/FixB family protein [Ancylobacter oerskovii]
MSRTRRDPREEREARRLAGSGRPRWRLDAPPTSGRLRRDPRREIDALRVAGTTRLRLDRTGRAGPLALPTIDTAAVAAPTIRIVDDPAYLVTVVPDAPGGRLAPLDRQLLGAARTLADAGGGAVLVLSFGQIDGLGAAGADRIVALDAESGDPSARAAALAIALAALQPRHMLLPESAGGGDLARRLAAKTGEALFAGAESLTARLATRPAANRRIEQRGAPPRLVTLAPDAHLPHAGAPHEARAIAAPEGRADAPHTGILSIEDLPVAADALPLAEADFVISAGNGITDFELFRALARALGATPGASRMVCDAGLMPRAAQVGASGTVLEASCYFALGISGAPQHLQGVARCEHVVAVNTDLHAAMVERAGLAIIADAQQVMPALIALLTAEGEE